MSVHKNEKDNFSGQLGFVLAAAGSAVGVGNLWRFPYFAAKDGGGLFLLIYFFLVIVFGTVFLASDIAIGRRTGKSSIFAYTAIAPRWKFLGIVTFMVPVIIMCYYSVIGGWILKYTAVYLTGGGSAAAGDGYFISFISSNIETVVFALVFLFLTSFIVFSGIKKGIERYSKILMPILLLLIIFIASFSLTLSYTDSSGATRTGIDGLKIYLTPDFSGLTFERFLQISLDAMGQVFFSLSVSMGIMITYGSYVKKNVNLNKSVYHIQFFDTVVALLAGSMIIPAIYVFCGLDGMNAGPGLMFISLPKVFEAMGAFGSVIAIVFFVSAAFAALTSCVSVLESIVANFLDLFKNVKLQFLRNLSRKKIVLITSFIYAAATVTVALGYSVFYFELELPNGSKGQLIDVLDYISNNFMMPFISVLSCILIGWIIRPKWIIEEMEYPGYRCHFARMYTVVIRYIAPVVMLILFVQSTGIV